MQFKNNDSLNDLINQAGKTTGVDPQSLKATIDSGKLDNLLSKMNPKDAAKYMCIRDRSRGIYV